MGLIVLSVTLVSIFIGYTVLTQIGTPPANIDSSNSDDVPDASNNGQTPDNDNSDQVSSNGTNSTPNDSVNNTTKSTMLPQVNITNVSFMQVVDFNPITGLAPEHYQCYINTTFISTYDKGPVNIVYALVGDDDAYSAVEDGGYLRNVSISSTTNTGRASVFLNLTYPHSATLYIYFVDSDNLYYASGVYAVRLGFYDINLEMRSWGLHTNYESLVGQYGYQ